MGQKQKICSVTKIDLNSSQIHFCVGKGRVWVPRNLLEKSKKILQLSVHALIPSQEISLEYFTGEPLRLISPQSLSFPMMEDTEIEENSKKFQALARKTFLEVRKKKISKIFFLRNFPGICYHCKIRI